MSWPQPSRSAVTPRAETAGSLEISTAATRQAGLPDSLACQRHLRLARRRYRICLDATVASPAYSALIWLPERRVFTDCDRTELDGGPPRLERQQMTVTTRFDVQTPPRRDLAVVRSAHRRGADDDVVMTRCSTARRDVPCQGNGRDRAGISVWRLLQCHAGAVV